jgi:uncharacterized membrane protein/osmotically-inducible protein OsmY
MRGPDSSNELDAACDAVEKAIMYRKESVVSINPGESRVLETHIRRAVTLLLTGAALGAAAEYLLDPASGQRRRITIREKVTLAATQTRARMRTATRWLNDRTRSMGRNLSGRAKSAIARSKRAVERMQSMRRRGTADDPALERNVRNTLERAISRPRMIAVSAHEGSITLHGDVLPHEHEQVLSAVRSIRGVSDLTDHLMERASDHHTWLPRDDGAALQRERWSPTARIAAGALGGALLIAGVRQRSLVAVLGALVGGPLLLRSATNTPLKRLGPGGGVIDVRKSILVHAPIDRVFRLLEAYENYPAFMRSVQKVMRQADGTSHWVLGREGKASLEGDSRTTVHRPNEMLAWQSLPDSKFEHSGVIRFQSVGKEQTRLDIHISYRRPAGAFGHAVRSLFDTELTRMKTFAETGRTETEDPEAEARAAHAKLHGVPRTDPSREQTAPG